MVSLPIPVWLVGYSIGGALMVLEDGLCCCIYVLISLSSFRFVHNLGD